MFKYVLKTYDHDTELYSHGTFITTDNIIYQILRDIDFLKVGENDITRFNTISGDFDSPQLNYG